MLRGQALLAGSRFDAAALPLGAFGPPQGEERLLVGDGATRTVEDGGGAGTLVQPRRRHRRCGLGGVVGGVVGALLDRSKVVGEKRIGPKRGERFEQPGAEADRRPSPHRAQGNVDRTLTLVPQKPLLSGGLCRYGLRNLGLTGAELDSLVLSAPAQVSSARAPATVAGYARCRAGPKPPAEKLQSQKVCFFVRLLTSDEVESCKEHFVVPSVAPVPGHAPEQSRGRL